MLLVLKVAGDTRSARGADACPTTADEIATDRPDVTNSSLVVLCVAKYKLRRRRGSQRGRCSVFAGGMSQGLRLDGQERQRAELG